MLANRQSRRDPGDRMGSGFAVDLLDSMNTHIAVLDVDGVVIAVNEAWKEYARENGCQDDAYYVGTNYLSVCTGASPAEGDCGSSLDLLTGIPELLKRTRSKIEFEYPCHSPDRKRWFMARLTRFVHEGASYVTVVHEDITERKLMEEELREAHLTVDAVNRELQRVLAGERRKARTDELTGLNNRRQFLEVGRQLLNVAQRYAQPLSIVLFDIDYFKRTNDTYGHRAGDAVLRSVARVAREHSRQADVVARYGGEEFILALPNTKLADALVLAEGLRKEVAACRIDIGGRNVAVTMSAGVAQSRVGETTIDALIERADRALYMAKGSGRDCCRAFTGEATRGPATVSAPVKQP